eukprot:gnl/MRDRNA2_/MRDRNA2_88864_c0_seq1.p1 gnl/MRDRNA2_/MRDRNA2_88864_c0~~gnl/MRDRNA2_/MRDRNA2_88864_c0_seq1.p1  ORF type:complete len:342 (-),score=58.68 gnl/MRDRNA2_/MRDRNA2_88864_c0_seq1:114-1139(-)
MRQRLRSPLITAINEALARIEYPDKDAVWKHVVGLGYKSQRRFTGYKFIHRGGLSSPHVAYVTDIDFIFNNPNHGQIDLSDFDSMVQLARNLCIARGGIISAKVAWEDTNLFDAEVDDLRTVRQQVANGADLAVITGRYQLQSGWQVSMDFTLQRGDSKMTKQRRIARMWDNMNEGNYAKVVSRIRGILSPHAKATFASEWNKVGGAYRFLVKQLELVRFMTRREQDEYMSYLYLPSDTSLQEWADAATAEMHRHALQLLQMRWNLLEAPLRSEAKAFRAALDAAGQAQCPLEECTQLMLPKSAGKEWGTKQSKETKVQGSSCKPSNSGYWKPNSETSRRN